MDYKNLDSTFLIDSGDLDNLSLDRVHNDYIETETIEVEIPEIKDLDLISNLALDAYKVSMANLSLIPAEQLTNYLLMCERYLNQAKDAIFKRDSLIQKYELSKGNKQKSQEGTVEKGGTVSRDELAEIRRKRLQNMA